MWHRLLVPVLSLLTLFHSTCDSYTQMVDRVSASVIRVTGTLTEETFVGPVTERYVCSGEVIAPHHVLTAGHCVGEDILADGIPAMVIRVDKEFDLALLQVETQKPVLPMRDSPVARFEPLTGIGYAKGVNRLTVLAERPVLVDYSPAPTLIPKLFVQNGYIDGMSGGPVVDQYGRMVGIIQQTDEGVGTLLIRAFLLGT